MQPLVQAHVGFSAQYDKQTLTRLNLNLLETDIKKECHGRRWLEQCSQSLSGEIKTEKLPALKMLKIESCHRIWQQANAPGAGSNGEKLNLLLGSPEHKIATEGAFSMPNVPLQLNIGFFTAVDYGDLPKTCFQFLLEKVDSYFYLGGRKARVISNEISDDSQEVQLVNGSSSWLMTSLKVASYFTVIAPLIGLAAKAVLRSLQQFHLKSEERALVLPPLTEVQQAVATKLAKATHKVVSDVLTTIISSSSMSPQEFADTHIVPKQVSLAEMDERTRTFFHKMMEPINEDLKKVPTLANSMKLLAASLDDDQIQQKLVESIAFSTLQQLISDLDALKSTIVDDIIGS